MRMYGYAVAWSGVPRRGVSVVPRSAVASASRRVGSTAARAYSGEYR